MRHHTSKKAHKLGRGQRTATKIERDPENIHGKAGRTRAIPSGEKTTCGRGEGLENSLQREEGFVIKLMVIDCCLSLQDK